MENKTVILIVGPSGVGKDTLLRSIKEELDPKRYHFVQRYITREPDENENNFYIEDNAFKILDKSCYFISSWQAHSNFYGISLESICNCVNIISISRGAIKDFEKVFKDTYTIYIDVAKEVLRERLENRGRENKEEIEKRLARSYEEIEAKNLIEFDNSAPLEKSKSKFLEIIRNIGEA